MLMLKYMCKDFECILLQTVAYKVMLLPELKLEHNCFRNR